MRAVQVSNTKKTTVTLVTSTMTMTTEPSGATPFLAKALFTGADLLAVGLEKAEVPYEMQAPTFGIGAVLPWFEVVRSEAADALGEM